MGEGTGCLKRMRTVCALLVVAATAPATGEDSLKRFEYSEVAMGGRARIVVYASDEDSAATACRAAFRRIADLEDVMSDYRPDSELMRLCANSGGPAAAVSPDLSNVLLRCVDLSARSEGAFDVTVGPLARLWRAARRSGAMPDPAELADARRRSGWRKMVVNADTGTVRLVEPGMLLDLGAIAKGYACDEALRILRQAGLSRALVEMGGDIAVGDPPPGADGWEIRIAHAPPGRQGLPIANAAVSTSGDTEQFVEIEGRSYSHILDPRTGVGLTGGIAVTVIAPEAATSDGLATAVCVLGEPKGRELVSKYRGARIAWIGRAVN